MSHRACLMLALCLAFPAAARAAEPFDSFRVPDYRTFNWLGGVQGSGTWAQRNRSWTISGNNEKRGRLFGRTGSQFDWTRSTDPSLTTLRGSLDLSGDRDDLTGDAFSFSPGSSVALHDERTQSQAREHLELGASNRQYPFAVPAFYSVSISASLDDRQVWVSEHARYDYDFSGVATWSEGAQSSLYKTYEGRLREGAGVGIGRVRNATPLYEAILLEDRLRHAGVLTRPLGAEARRALGALMYTRGAFAATRDRPARELWKEIAHILERDGALNASPGPETLLRLMEPFFGPSAGIGADGLPVSPVGRSLGMSFAMSVEGQHARRSVHQVSAMSFASSSSPGDAQSYGTIYRQTSDDVVVYAAADFHRPLSMRWQLDATGNATFPARQGLGAFYAARLSATWLVADRWSAAFLAGHDWSDARRTAGPTGADVATWQARTDLSWYVESRTALSLSLSQIQSWRRGDGVSIDHAFDRFTQVSVGVTRRFAGRFAAPALAFDPSPPTIDLAP